MPFTDLPEGTTHHDFDSCYKCTKCNAHFFRRNELGLCVECTFEITRHWDNELIKQQ